MSEPELVEIKGSQLDFERLAVVAGELEYLRSIPNDRLPSHTEVRLVAVVLRRLFIDDWLETAWKLLRPALGFERGQLPAVKARSLDPVWGDRSIAERIVHAWSGGGSFGPIEAQHQGFWMFRVPRSSADSEQPDSEILARIGDAASEAQIMSIREWMKSAVHLVNHDDRIHRVSRRDVLKYTNNYRGGAHLSPTPNGRVNYEARSGKARDRAVARLLGQGTLRIGHLRPFEYEVAVMGQQVAEADWCDYMIDAARQNVPEEFDGDATEIRAWALNEWSTWKMRPGRASTG